MILEDIIKKGKEIHGDIFEYYELLKIKDKIHIHLKCKICGDDFNQYYYSHISKKCGCSKCKNNKKQSLEEIAERGKIVHSDNFDYLELINKNNTSYVKIKCKKCYDIIETSTDNHLNKKSGCSKCKNTKKLTLEEIAERGNIIHDDNFEYIEVIKTKKGSGIRLRCKKCNKISTPLIDNHLNKEFGCKYCMPKSKGVIKIDKYLEKNNIKFIKEKKFEDCKHIRCLSFDYYLPEYNLLIEYNGEQHYREISHFGGKYNFEQSQIRDKIKIEYCAKNNKDLLIITYLEIKNINNILKEKLKVII